jgi:Conjugative transposon protein TcpC
VRAAPGWPAADPRWPGTDETAAEGNGVGVGRPARPADADWLLGTAPLPAASVPVNRTKPHRERPSQARDYGTDITAASADRSLIRQIDGAPATSMPGLAGRFAAEWCPAGTTSRSYSLQRERGRTGGGVMVRRAILDREETLTGDDQALPPSQFPAEPVRKHDRQWRGAGGRWLVWMGRAIVWAVLLLVGYRGVLAIVKGQESDPAAPRSSAIAPVRTAFPVALAEAYALQFGDAYLNFSPADATARAAALSHFLAPSADPQLGWNGAGSQRLQAEQVAGISVTSPHSAVVTLLASLNANRMIELGVPIYAGNGGMSVAGSPALLPAPRRVAAPAPAAANSDQSTEAALQGQLPAFFAAYASGDPTTLERFAAPGAHLRSLSGAVSFGGIDAVFAPPGGAQRSITVTVTWKLAAATGASGSLSSAPAALEMTYQLVVLRQGASWDVQSIGALAPSLGPP